MGCSARNHYDALEIKRDASAEVIKKQYRALAKKYHPDKTDDPKAQDKFIEISSAYEILSDPSKRSEYDHRLRYGGGGDTFGKGHQHQHQHQHPAQSFQQFQRNQQQSNSGYQYYEFRTPDGRVYRSYSYGFGGNGQQYQQPQSLAMWALELLWASPIPFFLFLFCLYQCVACCISPLMGQGGRGNARPHTRQPAPPQPEVFDNSYKPSSSQQTTTPNDDVSQSIRQRKCIVVVSCTALASKLVGQLQKRYRADPVLFINNNSEYSSEAEVAWKCKDKVIIIATCKGGRKWAAFEGSGLIANQISTACLNDVDIWITKLVTGEVPWTDALIRDIPSVLSLVPE